MKAPPLVPLLLLLCGVVVVFYGLPNIDDAVEKEGVPTKSMEPQGEKEEGVPKPPPSGNRFLGPHDGRHVRAGMVCEACKYKPLEF